MSLRVDKVVKGNLVFHEHPGSDIQGGHIGSVVPVDTVSFNTSFADGHQEGRLQWNTEDGTLEYGLAGNNVNLQIGQETVVKVSNGDTGTITNGTVVTFVGSQGNRPKAYRCIAGDPIYGHPCGVATEDIISNGYVTTNGLVRDIDTSTLSVGVVYINGTGGLTSTRPTFPNEPFCVGMCLVSGVGNGLLYVNPQNIKYYSEFFSIGATLPTTPVEGQLFVHTPANRSVLMQYVGGAWKPIYGFGDVIVYVDSVNGTDSLDNGFGTGVNAFKKLSYALASVPRSGSGSNLTFYLSGTFDPNIEGVVNFEVIGYSWGTVQFYGEFTVYETGNLTSYVKGTTSTRGSITDTSKAWTTDQWKGYFVKTLMATGVTYSHPIYSNTSDTLTIVGIFNGSNTPVLAYEIVKMATKIDYTGGTALGSVLTVYPLQYLEIYNVDLSPTTGTSNSVITSLNASTTSLFECSADRDAGFFLANTSTVSIVRSYIVSRSTITGSPSGGVNFQNSYIVGKGTKTYTACIASQFGTIGSNITSTFENWNVGIQVESQGSATLSASAGNGYVYFQDCNTAVTVASGGTLSQGTGLPVFTNVGKRIAYQWTLGKTSFSRVNEGASFGNTSDMSTILEVKQKTELQEISAQWGKIGELEAVHKGNGEFLDKVVHLHNDFVAPSNPCTGCLWIDQQ